MLTSMWRKEAEDLMALPYTRSMGALPRLGEDFLASCQKIYPMSLRLTMHMHSQQSLSLGPYRRLVATLC